MRSSTRALVHGHRRRYGSLKLVESRDPHREKQVRRRISQIYLAGDDDPNRTRERDKTWPTAGAGGGLHTERTEG